MVPVNLLMCTLAETSTYDWYNVDGPIFKEWTALEQDTLPRRCLPEAISETVLQPTNHVCGFVFEVSFAFLPSLLVLCFRFWDFL